MLTSEQSRWSAEVQMLEFCLLAKWFGFCCCLFGFLWEGPLGTNWILLGSGIWKVQSELEMKWTSKSYYSPSHSALHIMRSLGKDTDSSQQGWMPLHASENTKAEPFKPRIMLWIELFNPSSCQEDNLELFATHILWKHSRKSWTDLAHPIVKLKTFFWMERDDSESRWFGGCTLSSQLLLCKAFSRLSLLRRGKPTQNVDSTTRWLEFWTEQAARDLPVSSSFLLGS